MTTRGEKVAELAGVARTFEPPPGRSGAGGPGPQRREVLQGASLEVFAGELVAIVGPSGCGKTTLLNILGTLDPSFTGEVKVLGRSLARLGDDEQSELRNRSIGFVFQAFHLLDHLTVMQNVEVPLWLFRERIPRSEEASRAAAALATVGLGDRLDEPVRPLSGGERQRVAIARAIVNRPVLLLADEPTGNLDRETGRSIYALFERIKRGEGTIPPCAVVVATHDPELAALADRSFTMRGGVLARTT